MEPRDEVLAAARARADALVASDSDALRRLLHPAFRWVSHTGEHFDRDSYTAANTAGDLLWLAQDLGDPEIVLVGATAVLQTVVRDVVRRRGEPESYRMAMTQVWIRGDDRWRCVGGHAGPRLPEGPSSQPTAPDHDELP